ncbi:ROK family transcriptional regulator [Melioribacter sp. Ez-97]|uniref:ROK family transcriptional regulator n=1 Tax=Melioribacter sp. Ez-97 TaxID=3423434 RepID=UPI003ED967F0
MRSKKLISFHARVVKDINEQLVLNLIQENEVIASSELAKITGMRPSTIFNILKELSAKSFVLFYGKGDSTSKGGKKPYMWTLNKDAAYVIGLDIEVGEMSLVVLNFKGELIYKRNIKIDTVNSVDELANSIITAINLAIEENKLEHSKILGAGIAFAGIVDCQRGVVVMSSILPDLNFNLLEKLKVFPFKIFLENNANAVAVGYKWKNNVKARRNYLTVLIEIDKNVSGLGIGIVINGTLYRGSSYCAGELYPHLPTLKEIVASYRSRFPEGKAMKNYMNSLDSIDIELVLQAAKEGDEIAKLIFSKIGSIVGQTIAPAVSLLNPDTLILTGVVSELEEIIVDSVRKEIEMRVISITSNALDIVVDRYHQFSVAVGAASLVLENFFKLPVVKQ